MNYAPEPIGVGKYTAQLAEHLAKGNYTVEVVTAHPHYPAWRVVSTHPWRWTSRQEAGVRIIRCPLVARSGARIWRLLAPLTFALAAAPALIARGLAFRPQVVVCVEPTLFAAPAALLAAWLAGARTVLHVQDLEVDAAFATGHLAGRTLRRVAAAAERLLLARFDAVVTISDAMASRLRRRGVAAGRIAVLRNWIGPAAAASAEATASLRDALPVPAGRKIVLYAGNLGLKQGLPLLIDAARRLRARSDLHFLFVGDGPMAPALRAAAVSLPNLTLTGVLPAGALRALLALADCHVVPQDRAAGDLVFPSKLGAILASGRPCVITSEAWRELARWAEGAATVVPPGDADALAEAVVQAVAEASGPDPARAQALAASLAGSHILAQFERVLQPVPRARPAAAAVLAPAESGPLPAG